MGLQVGEGDLNGELDPDGLSFSTVLGKAGL